MLDRALARAFANLSTLFLVACVVAVPVHLIQAYVYRDVLAVRELGPDIARLPEGRRVRGVSPGDFTEERKVLFIALGAQALLLPVVLRATRRVLQRDDEGEVPTVVDAWSHLGETQGGYPAPGPVIAAAVIGGVAAMIAWSITNLVAGMASASSSWVLYGLGRAGAVALFVGIVAGTAAALAPGKAPAPPPEKLDLY